MKKTLPDDLSFNHIYLLIFHEVLHINVEYSPSAILEENEIMQNFRIKFIYLKENTQA
jgi:hypothetical protein